MPKCFSCNKTFKNWQALGNQIRKHHDNSESNKGQNLDVSLFNYTNFSQSHESVKEQNIKFFNYANDFYSSNTSNNESIVSDTSDSYSNISNNESAVSDLLDITNTDINEFAEYNNLIARKWKGLEDIYQEFPSEEYAEFMNIITCFHVQDPLANAFIRFFNKYSNHNDYLLPSSSLTGWVFIKNLNLPNFG
ncbi:17177_t:CDS:2 [Cetraspora pellucida]|uniref:17177_t:CDS:1 n=1 Tax=Cetraspora pellucida TaxID=1433469 RepID=A0A9N9EB75_9GLOM|nr:17177_t:CDS:2 [Cetraspora pellucida]